VVALARVTRDLDEARGPDVLCSIEVPAAWFEVGATLQISLPRLLSCARCDGGGCDACGRRGAFEQRASGIANEVAIVLPIQPAGSSTAVRLRLPALGARAPAETELPSGHLLLTVIPHLPEPGWSPAANVQALDLPAVEPPLLVWARQTRERLWLLRRRQLALRERLSPYRLWILALLAVLIIAFCLRLLQMSH
jgi:hypothetical protein